MTWSGWFKARLHTSRCFGISVRPLFQNFREKKNTSNDREKILGKSFQVQLVFFFNLGLS